MVSPKLIIDLIERISWQIEQKFEFTRTTEAYFKRWQGPDTNNPAFEIIKSQYGMTPNDVVETLGHIEDELILKIAVDLGIETPDFIPSVATFRNEIKASYATASTTFEKATRTIEQDPSTAILQANSALESIIKEILKNEAVKIELAKLPGEQIKSVERKTLTELTNRILKILGLFPDNGMTNEFKTIGSSLLALNGAIEDIRSTKTHAHGKTDGDYVVNDALYAYFVVNSVATAGLFLKSYYEKKFKVQPPEEDDDMPY